MTVPGFNFKLFVFTVLIMGGSQTANALPTIMDFGIGDTQLIFTPNSYVEDGFRATPIDSGVGPSHFDIENRDAGNERELLLHQDNNAEEVEIDNFGTAFALSRLDIEEITGGPPLYEIISSAGGFMLFTNIGTIFFSGSDWTNLQWIRIRSTVIPLDAKGSGEISLTVDNIVFNGAAIPEPCALALFSFGFAGLRFARRWKAA